MRKLLSIVLFCLAAILCANADGLNKHVVVVVWDGMRPDFISGRNTPALYELIHRGVFFAHNHSVYVTSTEVNGTALATGDYPQHSSVIANRELRPEIDPLAPFGTETLEAMRKGDELGGYLSVPTLAETLQRRGFLTAIAGSKPVVLLQDHARRPDNTANVVLYEGQTLPLHLVTNFTDGRILGPFPPGDGSKTNEDVWTTRALAELIWKKDVPAFSLLWLAEPDNTQHQTGVGSAESLAAIRNSDWALSRIITELKARGVFDSTDLIVVSDHGFSTISKEVDVVAELRHAGFKAARRFSSPPAKGNVLVVGLGGSALIYAIGHEENTVSNLVSFLQTQDFVGPIFTLTPQKGTFPLEDGLIHSRHAPDIVFSFRWTAETNSNGAPGYIISESQGSNLSLGSGQKATHASLSPFDLHNTLVAAGPDFREGFTDETPSGNVDVAPTVLKLLGVKPLQAMDGRVLSEALKSSDERPPKIERKELSAHTPLPGGEWSQRLSVTYVDGVQYIDEGT
ncbi:MAG TPA: alkaline phosphatase family protein, partial [Verrucomicrobiae bacterium]|nr:alkaline phosphatase family protein [Verrucomicrobiae bacterium]